MPTSLDSHRCPWPTKPLDIAYHDTEWGVPLHDDRALFELLTLEGAQAGLSWSIVLAKRDPTARRIDAWRSAFSADMARTGGVDVARMVYCAHLGLVDDAYAAADACRLGPAGGAGDIMGPDGYRTALMFQADMPELRDDPRFAGLCARLGLVDFWIASDKWPDCASDVPYDFQAACLSARDTPREPSAYGLIGAAP